MCKSSRHCLLVKIYWIYICLYAVSLTTDVTISCSHRVPARSYIHTEHIYIYSFSYINSIFRRQAHKLNTMSSSPHTPNYSIASLYDTCINEHLHITERNRMGWRIGKVGGGLVEGEDDGDTRRTGSVENPVRLGWAMFNSDADAWCIKIEQKKKDSKTKFGWLYIFLAFIAIFVSIG